MPTSQESEAQGAVEKCGYCGLYHEALCPRIAAIDLDEFGKTRRVEFFPPVVVTPRETDDELRKRLLEMVGASVNRERIKKAIGAELDELAATYVTKRIGT